MFSKNADTIWYGAWMAIVFFSCRFLFHGLHLPSRDELAQSGLAGGIALAVGLGLGYLLRNQTQLTRFLVALGLVALGIAINVIA